MGSSAGERDPSPLVSMCIVMRYLVLARASLVLFGDTCGICLRGEVGVGGFVDELVELKSTGCEGSWADGGGRMGHVDG